MRAPRILQQLKDKKRFSDVAFRSALTLFLVGSIKKVCIAYNVAVLPDTVFSDVGAYGALSVWTAVLAYAIQIYCDFSGYTDMAIAVASRLGYDLAVNFRWPYFAENIQEVWMLAFCFLGIVHAMAYKGMVARFLDRLPAPVFAFAHGLVFALIMPFVPMEYRPFVYFQF